MKRQHFLFLTWFDHLMNHNFRSLFVINFGTPVLLISATIHVIVAAALSFFFSLGLTNKLRKISDLNFTIRLLKKYITLHVPLMRSISVSNFRRSRIWLGSYTNVKSE